MGRSTPCGSALVVALVPPIVHAIHETLRRGARSTLPAARTRCGRDRAPATRGHGEHDTREHRNKSDDSDNDPDDGNLRRDADDQADDADDDEQSADREVSVAERAPFGGRADDIGVVAHQVAFHLVEKALFLFGEWHLSPRVVKNVPLSLVRPVITRLGP